MPIYAYRCTTCGHAQDTLQKISDPVLTVCPACGAATYQKQLTAAGFQLKGSGWYVTDFRDGAKKADGSKDAGAEKGVTPAAPAPADKPAETKSETKSETAAAPAAPAAPAPTPSSGS